MAASTLAPSSFMSLSWSPVRPAPIGTTMAPMRSAP